MAAAAPKLSSPTERATSRTASTPKNRTQPRVRNGCSQGAGSVPGRRHVTEVVPDEASPSKDHRYSWRPRCDLEWAEARPAWGMRPPSKSARRRAVPPSHRGGEIHRTPTSSTRHVPQGRRAVEPTFGINSRTESPYACHRSRRPVSAQRHHQIADRGSGPLLVEFEDLLFMQPLADFSGLWTSTDPLRSRRCMDEWERDRLVTDPGLQAWCRTGCPYPTP